MSSEQKLRFYPTVQQTGFTNSSLSSSNDKDPSVIVREIVQNSLDAALLDAKKDQAEIKFELKDVLKTQIPGYDKYLSAIKSIEKNIKDSGSDQKRDILSDIQKEIESDSISVLMVTDNGIGFDDVRLHAIFADGISLKPDPTAAGSYGNGHFSAFNISGLRYIFYGGIRDNGSRVASGQALLRTFMDNDGLKTGYGFYTTSNNALIKGNNVYPTGKKIPEIISKELDEFKGSGSILAIFGFNFFGQDKDRFFDLISSSVARNFFVALHNEELVVEIANKNKKILLNKGTLESILESTSEVKSGREKLPSYKIAKKFYNILLNGNRQDVDTDAGKVIVCFENSETDTQLAVCRNGMWISKNLPNPLSIGNFSEYRNFNALILPYKTTYLSRLMRKIEGSMHADLYLNRFKSSTNRTEFQKSLDAIKMFLHSKIEKNNDESFDVNIPELSIQMLGSSTSKVKTSRSSNKVSKKPSAQRDVDGDGTEDKKKTSERGDSKLKTDKKKRSGSPFYVASASARHTNDGAKIIFKADKNSENLLLILRIDDGTDPSCDSLGYVPPIEIKSASSNNEKLLIDNNDTIVIGKVDVDELVNISIDYSLDSNLKNFGVIYDFYSTKSTRSE